jgi:hypothetical protein
MKSLKYKKLVLAIIIIAITNGLISLTSCKKQDDFLNVKRLNSDVTPSTLQDFQAVLDNISVFNSIYPSIGLLGTDNAYLTDATLNTATSIERNSYIWAKDIFQGQASAEWNNGYQIIEYANIVLDGLQKIIVNTANQSQFNQIKGSALFYRSLAFYGLAELFSPPYDSSTANSDLGIPLRLSSDVNIPSVRATVQQTFNQIVGDLQTAANLLPQTAAFTTRPSQVSCNALLSKVFLCVQDYPNAGQYANKALTSNGALLDYNSSLVNKTSTYHFPTFQVGNPEIIFWAFPQGYATLRANGPGIVDTLLYNSYAANDLRKSLYYKSKGIGSISFVGSYLGTLNRFAGIANNEVYLIRAECYARAGNASAAMTDLNTLLVKRWISGTFVPYTAVSSTDALTQILQERRKELPFTGLVRWEDLRRLNKDPRFATSINHKYNGTTYTLSPNDKKYAYPIPDLEIQKYGLQQNSR